MLDQRALEAVVGIAGNMTGDVFKISVPRHDLKVSVDGFEIIPFMGLTELSTGFKRGLDAQRHTAAAK